MHVREAEYWQKMCKQLGVEANAASLATIEQMTLSEIKRHYSVLLKEYSVLFGRIIQ